MKAEGAAAVSEVCPRNTRKRHESRPWEAESNFNGMNTLVDAVKSAGYRAGHIVIVMESGVEVRFPTAGNPRLARGNPRQLNNIEVSPFGLHWPDLDEDLSLRGLLEGDYGQKIHNRMHGCNTQAVAHR